MDPRLTRYIDEGGWQTVPGAIDATLFPLMRDIDAIQKRLGIKGDLAEIGVYGGRLLIMLGLLARPDEKALAIDVFDVEDNYDATGGATSIDSVRNNFARFVGSDDGLALLVGDSMHLRADGLRGALPSGQARMFSIDGAHSHYHTANDMLLAEAVIAPGGVVTVDDIVNPGWPGVMEGVGRYFLQNSCCRLFPFMMAYNKLWLTTHDHHQRFLDYARDSAPVEANRLKRITRFYGTDIVGF